LDIHSGLDSFSHEKKGMSPLIATVLLIAFAVALGAMIMNWSSSLGEDNSGPDCSTISFIISPYLCYAENMIKMSVKTDKAVESVTVRVIDQNIQNDISLKNSKLPPGGVLQKDISYVKPEGKTYIGLIPSIKHKNEIVPCENPVYELGDLPKC